MNDPAPRDPALVTTATTLPVPGTNVPRSAASFLAIIAGLVVVKMIVARFFPTAFASPSQATVFWWRWIGAFAGLGLVGVWFASRTGFPETWDPRIPVRNRVFLPAVIGIVLGAIAVGVDALTNWTGIVAAQMHAPNFHIAFPASLIIYPAGAAITNILFYLIPIPPLLWLLSSLAMRGRWQTVTFWVVGVCAAAVEPVLQDFALTGHPMLVAVTFAQDYALNLAQVATFRRAGFGASVVLRAAFYLVWHVLWGAFRS